MNYKNELKKIKFKIDKLLATDELNRNTTIEIEKAIKSFTNVTNKIINESFGKGAMSKIIALQKQATSINKQQIEVSFVDALRKGARAFETDDSLSSGAKLDLTIAKLQNVLQKEQSRLIKEIENIAYVTGEGMEPERRGFFEKIVLVIKRMIYKIISVSEGQFSVIIPATFMAIGVLLMIFNVDAAIETIQKIFQQVKDSFEDIVSGTKGKAKEGFLETILAPIRSVLSMLSDNTANMVMFLTGLGITILGGVMLNMTYEYGLNK